MQKQQLFQALRWGLDKSYVEGSMERSDANFQIFEEGKDGKKVGRCGPVPCMSQECLSFEQGEIKVSPGGWVVSLDGTVVGVFHGG